MLVAFLPIMGAFVFAAVANKDINPEHTVLAIDKIAVPMYEAAAAVRAAFLGRRERRNN